MDNKKPMLFAIQQAPKGTPPDSSEWKSLSGDQYHSQLSVNGQKGALMARFPGSDFRVLSVEPAKPVQFVDRRRETIGEMISRLWLAGLPLGYIDNRIASYGKPFQPNAQKRRKPRPQHDGVRAKVA